MWDSPLVVEFYIRYGKTIVVRYVIKNTILTDLLLACRCYTDRFVSNVVDPADEVGGLPKHSGYISLGGRVEAGLVGKLGGGLGRVGTGTSSQQPVWNNTTSAVGDGLGRVGTVNSSQQPVWKKTPHKLWSEVMTVCRYKESHTNCISSFAYSHAVT